MNTTVFYAVALAVAGFVINLVSYFTGLQTDYIRYSQYVQWGVMALIFVGLYLGADARRKELPNARFTFGQAFLAVFLIGLLYTALAVVTGYIHTQFIHPDFAQYMLAHIREQIVAQGVPENSIENVMSFQEKLFSPVGMILAGVFGGLFLSGFLGLLHAMALIRRRSLVSLLVTYAIILGCLGMVTGGLGGLAKGGFLVGAAKGLAINAALALAGWGLLLKFTGYAADAPPPTPEETM